MNLPSLDDWTFFDRIARARSLTQAAREWGVSVAAVSKRLAQLEARLGVTLVKRSTRLLTLTDEGLRLASGAARILGEIREVEDSLVETGHDLRGSIAVHSTLGLGRVHVAPLLAEFATQHPRLRIELETSALPLNISGTPFDIGVRVGTVNDSRLHTRLLHRQRRIVCASPGYVTRYGSPSEPAELAQHNCIILRENDGDYALWRFGTRGGEQTVRVDGSLITNDGEIATAWSMAGRGIIMRSEWQVLPLIRDGSLVQLLPDFPTPEANITAVYSAGTAATHRVRSLLDHLGTGLRARLHRDAFSE